MNSHRTWVFIGWIGFLDGQIQCCASHERGFSLTAVTLPGVEGERAGRSARDSVCFCLVDLRVCFRSLVLRVCLCHRFPAYAR